MSPTNECPYVPYTTAGHDFDFSYPPIEVLSLDDSTVTFSVSQTLQNESICVAAVDYESHDEGPVCDSEDRVAPGEFSVYTSECVDGFAVITMFAMDSTFDDSNTADVPDRCLHFEQAINSKTVTFVFTTQCGTDT